MKKYLVIGNPIEHSLSPILHNYWIKSNNINATYDKQKLNENELEQLILKVKEKKISGINVTVPFKKKIIPYLDELSLEAESTQSVNTIYLKNNKVVVEGLNMAKKHTKPNPAKGDQGGLVSKEMPVNLSNIAIYNSKSNKKDKVNFKDLKDGKRIRIYKSTKEAIDV